MTIDDEKLRLWLEAAVESAFRAGAAEERAAVMAYLRERAASAERRDISVAASMLEEAAETIERGDHRREEKP